MLLMLVTLDVSKFERSSEVSDLQLSNMTPMFVTLDVSNELRSREVSDLQLLNISLMS
jgi:hypothetical protein